MANMQWIYNGTTNSIEWKARVIIDQFNQSIIDNTSQITVTFQFTRARSSSYAGNGATTAYITIDGAQYTISVPAYNYSSIGVDDWKTIATKTVTVGHDSVGWGSVNVSCSWSQSGVQPTSSSASGNPVLTVIPRASSIVCNDANIGSGTTINISRADSSFTHTLTYNFLGLTGTIATKTAQTSIGWTIPTSFYAKIPNSKSGTVTITCETFNGTTSLGTKTCTATCSVANSNPIVSATVIDSNTSAVSLTGSNQKLIKGVSNASITTAATGINNSTISKIEVSCSDGKAGTGAAVTLNGVTAAEFTIKVTDSRGFTNTITKTLTLIDYVLPAITEMSISRIETTSTTTKLIVSGNYFNGTFGSQANARQLSYYWREDGTSTWSSEIVLTPTTVSGNTFSYSANLAQTFDTEKAYEFTVRFKDKISSFDKNEKLGPSIPLVLAFRKRLEINGDIKSRYNYVNGTQFKGWGYTKDNVGWLGLSNTDTFLRMFDASTGVLNDYTYIGSSTGRFKKVFTTQADDVSSDRRMKTNIMSYDTQLEMFFKLLNPVRYELINGHTGRSHLGFIAQDVEAAMNEVGLEYKDMAFLQKCPLDSEGNEIDPATITDYETDERIKDYDYSLAYTELISLNTHMIQQLLKKVSQLEDEIKILKEVQQ